MNLSERELKRQYDRARSSGWLPLFQKAAKARGQTTALLLAHGSRETNMKNIRGDFRNGVYNGFGVLQVDIGTDRAFARNWSPTNVEPGIVRGSEILAEKLTQVVKGQGKTLSVRGRSFKGRAVEPDDARRIASAAYNCGLWAYYHFSKGENVDTTTTGDDYSRDVYDRAAYLAQWLDEDGIEPGAFRREIELQGKYARATVRKLADLEAELPERVKLPFGETQESDEALARTSYRLDDDEDAPAADDSDRDATDARTGAGDGAGGAEAAQAPPGVKSPASEGTSAPDAASAPVIVPQAKPEEDKPDDLLSKFKARYAALPAGVIAYLSAAGAWFTNAPGALIISLVVAATVIVVGYIVAYMILKNKREARDNALKLQREKQAHELTLKQIETAASRDLNTVRVVPNPVRNSDAAP